MNNHCAKTKALFAAKKRQNPTVHECWIQPPFSLSVCDTSYVYKVVHTAQEKKKTATRTPILILVVIDRGGLGRKKKKKKKICNTVPKLLKGFS